MHTHTTGINRPVGRGIRAALWTAQALLAGLFLFAGVMKLVLPPEALKGPVDLSIDFLRFIGVAEIVGAIGLILPSAVRIEPQLTSLAAVGLAIIMIGATVITAVGGPVAGAAVPAVVGIVTVLVAYGRWRVAPIAPRGEPIEATA